MCPSLARCSSTRRTSRSSGLRCKGFLRYYFDNITQIAEEAQFIPLPDEEAQKLADDLETAIGAAGA